MALFSLLQDWFATLSLVFGGCCSNAITLEQLTSQYPDAGSLITFFQFIIISLHGLPKHVTWTRYGPRFKPRRIPLIAYFVQVALFYLVSLLNNIAFGFKIPMSVHIIFRSGGLVITMLLGWIVAKKKYNITQVLSVLVVSIGVVLTTLSASKPSSSSGTSSNTMYTYLTGIAILTLALVFSGFLGLAQDWTYSKYGRPSPSKKGKSDSKSAVPPPTWQESLFYLHFLALPMFITVRKDLMTKLHALQIGPTSTYTIPLPETLASSLDSSLHIPPPFSLPFSLIGRNASSLTSFATLQTDMKSMYLQIKLPSAYLPLLLNTMTQLLCAAGVHRLTTRVSALTVTLILVIRKAVSLVLSVVFGFGKVGGGPENVDMVMMWTGAALVMLGTVGYSMGTKKPNGKQKRKEKGE
ncbi:udp-n-acetylglucosamine transporter [Moniliophthora roreri MCA 2997]|uniref:Udp-n-acetylglucosamine transporter n=2 Tax=Moniliophthora roreri TaxID=221103 RepID=V2XHE2_MONRO|nr:udp-n-acetylglucosamine transporter [Moniliophthora roreri MCA 2997]